MDLPAAKRDVGLLVDDRSAPARSVCTARTEGVDASATEDGLDLGAT